MNWIESSRLTWIINQFLTWILIFSDGKFLLNKLMIIFFFYLSYQINCMCKYIYIYICVWWHIWFTIISYFFNVMAVDKKTFNSCWTTSNVPLLIDWLIDDWSMVNIRKFAKPAKRKMKMEMEIHRICSSYPIYPSIHSFIKIA